jgi:hypothetical protein
VVQFAGSTIPYWVVREEDLEARPRREHLPDVPAGATMPGRWVDAGDLHVGDCVLLREGRVAPVDAVRVAPFMGLVYNFAVAWLACYAVGRQGILVHNQNGDPEAQPGGSPSEQPATPPSAPPPSEPSPPPGHPNQGELFPFTPEELPPIAREPGQWPASGVDRPTGLRIVDRMRQLFHTDSARNIAFADTAIEGQTPRRLVGISGAEAPMGTAPVPTQRRFQPRQTRGAIPTEVDSEAKRLEALAADLPQDAQGTISMFSERGPCPSCRRIIQQFRALFPNINLIVTDGGR